MQRLRDIVARSGSGILFLESRYERMRFHPFRTLYLALVRRWEMVRELIGLTPECVSVRTFYGDRITIPWSHSFSLRRYGFYEGQEMFLADFFIRHMRPGSVFIDGGAAFGWYTALAARLVGSAGRVYAFEPTPGYFGMLERNAREPRNVTCERAALWDHSGEIEFHDFGNRYGVASTALPPETIPFGDFLASRKSYRKIRVNAVSLDDYCARHSIAPDIVKLDVEGAESRVIRGAAKTLRGHPTLILEILRAQAESGEGQQLYDVLRAAGYHPYILRRDFMLSRSPDRVLAAFVPFEDVKNIVFIHESRIEQFSDEIVPFDAPPTMEAGTVSLLRRTVLLFGRFYGLLTKHLRGRGFSKYWVLRRANDALSSFFRRMHPAYVDVYGSRIYLDPEDSLGLSMGLHEPDELALVRDELHPGDIFVDVGANIGYYTVIAARLVGASGKVYAFEPAPEVLRYLRRNVSRNDLRNVTIVPKALADRSGEGELYLSDFNKGDHRIYNPQSSPTYREGGPVYDQHTRAAPRRSLPIALTTLDEVLADERRPMFFKLDVQGAEGAVLRGAQKILRRPGSVAILTEFWPAGLRLFGDDPRAVLDVIRRAGFGRLQYLDERKHAWRTVEFAVFEKLYTKRENISWYLYFTKNAHS
jgi:FkbM family methyltransferase